MYKSRTFSVYQKCSVTEKYAKMRFRHPSPDSTPFSAFGASISLLGALGISILAPSALATRAPRQACLVLLRRLRCFMAGYGPDNRPYDCLTCNSSLLVNVCTCYMTNRFVL